jgi:type II secretory pathway component GspD/PulD (secretin)
MTRQSRGPLKGIRAAAWLLCMFLFPLFTAWGNDLLSDVQIRTSGNDLWLFPSHRVSEAFIQQSSARVYNIDLPYFQVAKAPKIIVSPHPEVRFIRLTQSSEDPSVVRASLVLQPTSNRRPEVRDGRLLLAQAEVSPRPAVSAPTGHPTPAPIAIPQTPAERAAGIMDQRVNLQFQDEDISTILNALAVKFNLRVVADAGVKGRVTINAVDVPVRDLLKNLLLQRNFQYTLKGRELTVISLGQTSGRMARELLFKDLSLTDALQTLSKMMNINLVIHESVKDKSVNFFVENLSLDELLDLLISTNDLVKQPYNENTFIIMSKEEAKKYGQKQYRTFRLVNAKPDEVIKTIQGSKALADRIDTSNMAVNERINALSAYDTPANLELVARVIESVDEKLKQAVIELKLLEINRSSLKQLGVSLERYNITVGDIARIPKNYAFPATLEFLENEGKAKVLASPKIRAVHGKKASIHVGEVIPVPRFTYEVASLTLNTFERKTYFDQQVGITLDVTPEISRDNEISLELNTKVDSVIDINKDGQVHRSSKETNTFVRIKDGETVVLGGLISKNESTTKESPSILNRIPLFKTLLTHTKTENRDAELIMLVTPHLVNLDTPIDFEDTQSLYIDRQ